LTVGQAFAVFDEVRLVRSVYILISSVYRLRKNVDGTERWSMGGVGLRRELEARLLGGDYRGVMERAAELLSSSDGEGSEAAWAPVMACRAAGALRNWGRAVSWAERGLALGPDLEAEGWLNLLLGTALMYTGDAYRSERCLRAFLERAAGHPGLSRLLPDGRFNLAHLLRFLRRDPVAEAEAFQEAAEGFASRGRFSQVLLCQVEAAWSYLVAEQPAQALPALEAATNGLAEQGDPTVQVYVQICWAYYHRQTGDLARSQAICHELDARPDLTAGQRADVGWLLGSNARTMGDLTRAAAWAEKAYEHALEDLWPLQITRIEGLLHAMEGSGKQSPVRQVGR
jgi:tetratricopeptide (TPR) repeat protein